MKTRSDLEYLGYIWLGTVFLYTHNTTIFNVHYMILYEPQSAMTWLAWVVLYLDPIQFLNGMFSCYSEYTSHDCISTIPLNWTIYDNPILDLICSTLTTGKNWWTDLPDLTLWWCGRVQWYLHHTVLIYNGVEYLYALCDVQLLDLSWEISQLGCLRIVVLVCWWENQWCPSFIHHQKCIVAVKHNHNCVYTF